MADRTPHSAANPAADGRTQIAMKNGVIDPRSVPGWGVDADSKNDPTYPYRDRSGDEGLTKNWERPPQQESNVEILQSIEHIRRPAVFGTSTPPSGVSGMIRRSAFRWSESNWIHWLLLMGADRINVIEGVVEDLGRGKIPNIPAEMGVHSEWEHNKKGLATKVAVMTVVSVGLFALLKTRRHQPKLGSPLASSPIPVPGTCYSLEAEPPVVRRTPSDEGVKIEDWRDAPVPH
jgi:hypothetical protein